MWDVARVAAQSCWLVFHRYSPGRRSLSENDTWTDVGCTIANVQTVVQGGEHCTIRVARYTVQLVLDRREHMQRCEWCIKKATAPAESASHPPQPTISYNSHHLFSHLCS